MSPILTAASKVDGRGQTLMHTNGGEDNTEIQHGETDKEETWADAGLPEVQQREGGQARDASPVGVPDLPA